MKSTIDRIKKVISDKSIGPILKAYFNRKVLIYLPFNLKYKVKEIYDYDILKPLRTVSFHEIYPDLTTELELPEKLYNNFYNPKDKVAQTNVDLSALYDIKTEKDLSL